MCRRTVRSVVSSGSPDPFTFKRSPSCKLQVLARSSIESVSQFNDLARLQLMECSVRKLILSATMSLVLANPAWLDAKAATKAPAGRAETLSVVKVSLPGEGRGDYLYADTRSNRLFVTHSSVVHVLDLTTLKQLSQVDGLTAAHGVALDAGGRAYVTDGNSNSVLQFDPATGRVLKRIAVGKKPDSILFDPASSKIMAFDGNSEEVSVIDPTTGSVVATIRLPNAPEYSQADGRGHVYVNLEEGNAVAVINSTKMTVDHLISLNGCDGPAPLALDNANRRLFSGCGNNVMVVTNADSGKVLASVPIGGDPDGNRLRWRYQAHLRCQPRRGLDDRQAG